MIKTVAKTIHETLGIEINPDEEKILEKVLMNVSNDGIGPGYVIKDETIKKVRVRIPLIGDRERLVKTGIVEIINYQPQTTEERHYAKMLVKAGLLRHKPHTPHLYMTT